MKIKETIKTKATAVKDFVVRNERTIATGVAYCGGIIVGGICTAIGFKGGIKATCEGLVDALDKIGEAAEAGGEDQA